MKALAGCNAKSIDHGGTVLQMLYHQGPPVGASGYCGNGMGHQGQRSDAQRGNRLEALNTLLWTYDKSSWLPYVTAQDGDADLQPVWLTVGNENPNGAQFLFLTDRAYGEKLADYERVIMLFDNRDHDAVAEAGTRWKIWKGAGRKLSYWQQTPGGSWEKKAES